MRAGDDKLGRPGNLPEGDDLPEISDIIKQVRARTPARLLVGRSGAAYRTQTQLELRAAHAAARDAVRAELTPLAGDAGEARDDLARRLYLFEVQSRATNKDEYLLRPDLGRQLDDASRAEVSRRSVAGVDLQIVVGDGLSITAVAAQVPGLLPLLRDGAQLRGWSLGPMFVVRYCRVGILNQVGELLHPKVAILLIGERPGLATAESLSAYMAYQPKAGDTDAQRNLISNIHARGVRLEQAARRILNLADMMMKAKGSGFQLREELPALPSVHRRKFIFAAF